MMDDQDDLQVAMQQTLDDNNRRVIDIMFASNINAEDLEKLKSYCHYDYTKKRTDCAVCLESKLSHKCFQCTCWVCSECFININRNCQSSKCPSCRFEYSIPLLVAKTTSNIDALKKKYGTDALVAKIMPTSVYEEKKTPQPNNKIMKFTSEYNYRDNRLEVRADCNDNRTPHDYLKINMNIKEYPVPTQVNLLEKMHDVWCNTVTSGTSKAWNSAANKVCNKLRLKLSHTDLDQFLDREI